MQGIIQRILLQALQNIDWGKVLQAILDALVGTEERANQTMKIVQDMKAQAEADATE